MVSDAWLALLQVAPAGSREWHALLAAYGSAEALVAEPRRALEARGLPPEVVSALKSPDERVLERWRKWLGAPRHGLVTFGSPSYPPRLAATDRAPLALWTAGRDTQLLAAPQLAIVGSRSPTAGGRDTAEQFARHLAAKGLAITSGLAVGIDGASHRGALAEVGGTIAVLGSGLDVIFPRAHTRLAADIIERGMLVSEYAPGTAPQKWFFPERNRIIAGLSLGTLVVEATRRSGSLITARWALEFGREVFAIPGSIHNPLARGCHQLIREGAKLVEQASDILIELKDQLSLDIADVSSETRAAESHDTGFAADPSYQKLLDVLDFSPVSITTLGERSQLTTAELSSMLLVLELEGFVEALPGGRYSRLPKRV